MQTPPCSAVFSVHLPLTKGTPSSMRTAAVSVQLVWGQQLSGLSSLCKLVSRLLAHRSYSLHRCPPGTGQSRHSTLKTSPRETSPSHSSPSQPARPTLSGHQAAPSEKTTPGDPLPAPLQSEGQGGSTELSLERCCTYSLCCRLVAYICLATCPPPGRGDRTWKRLLSSCKTKLVFSGQLALPVEYRELPGAAGQAPRKG